MLPLSEKALVERAVELRTELENAASDVSSLFDKIGLYRVFWKLNFLDILSKNANYLSFLYQNARIKLKMGTNYLCRSSDPN